MLAESAAAEDARAYVAERRLSAEMVERFGLGFAPPEWDRLSRLATQKGYRAQELVDAGLASHGQRGPIDVFRGRLMFPLTDARGRVRGFAGRVMPGGEGAKYINSRETELFKKSQLLYGLHEARPAIGRSGRAIVVEGYTDVIQLHAAGFDNAVASMGTSLTEEQLRELQRLCGALVLAFDADAAGQEATLRGLRRAEQLEFDVRIVPLPPGQDPADLALAGAEAVEAALAQTRRVLEFELDLVLQRVGQDDPDAVYRDAREVLARVPESILRQEQVRRVAGALRLDERLTAGLVRRAARRADGGRRSPSACRSTSRSAASGSCSPPRSRRRRRGPRRWPRRRRAATCGRAPRSSCCRGSARGSPGPTRRRRRGTRRTRPRSSRRRPATGTRAQQQCGS